jgi:hypothetical protein
LISVEIKASCDNRQNLPELSILKNYWILSKLSFLYNILIFIDLLFLYCRFIYIGFVRLYFNLCPLTIFNIDCSSLFSIQLKEGLYLTQIISIKSMMRTQVLKVADKCTCLFPVTPSISFLIENWICTWQFFI